MFAKMVCSNICFYNRRDTWVNKKTLTPVFMKNNFQAYLPNGKIRIFSKKWQKLFEIKQQANVAIEEKRANKELGSSLEAQIKIYTNKEQFDL